MPQPFNDAIITAKGESLLLNVETGTASLEITKVLVGDGVYSTAEKMAANLRSRTALKNARNTYAPSSVSVEGEKSVKVTALISNQDPATKKALITSGYNINEIGVYAKVHGGSSSTEVLYCIAVTSGNYGDYMPPYNGGGAAQITQDIYLTVGNAATTYVNSAGAAALATDLLAAVERIANIEQMHKDMGISVADGKLCITYNEE